ncbi:MAG: glycosyltransferase family 4 protein [Armatimonadia bacterium]
MADRTNPRLGLIALNSGVPHLLGLVDDGAVGGFAVGGIEVQVLTLARALAARGWDITILAGDWGQPDEALTDDGLRVIKACQKRRSRLGKAQTALELIGSIGSLPVDILMLQGIHPAVGVSSFVSHRTGKRFVFWLASNTDATCTHRKTSRLPLGQRTCAGYGVRHADAVVTQTTHQRDLVRQNFRRDSVVIPNAWPVDVLKPGRADRPTALWVANLRWEKRPEMVLELAQAAPEINFLMVGGPMPGNDALYQHIVSEQHNYPNFEYAGFVPFSDVGRYFEQADVFINTSVVEGFPNTFLQAWDAQLPIVATFDPDSVLSREKLGYHCTEVPVFADKLRQLMANPEERQALGGRAKQYLRDNFSMEVVVPRLETLLREVASR